MQQSPNNRIHNTNARSESLLQLLNKLNKLRPHQNLPWLQQSPDQNQGKTNWIAFQCCTAMLLYMNNSPFFFATWVFIHQFEPGLQSADIRLTMQAGQYCHHPVCASPVTCLASKCATLLQSLLMKKNKMAGSLQLLDQPTHAALSAHYPPPKSPLNNHALASETNRST
jgi:hypothetical protein